MLEFAICLTAFWDETGKKFKKENSRMATGPGKKGRLREALSGRVSWTLASFLLGYVGVEGALIYIRRCTVHLPDGSSSLTLKNRSGTRRLDSDVHDACPPGRGVCFWHDGCRVLAGPDHRPCRPGIRDGQDRGEDRGHREPFLFASVRVGALRSAQTKLTFLRSQVYFVIAMGLEILFWLVPQFVVSAIAVSLVGFFLGPLFPAAVVRKLESDKLC